MRVPTFPGPPLSVRCAEILTVVFDSLWMTNAEPREKTSPPRKVSNKTASLTLSTPKDRISGAAQKLYSLAAAKIDAKKPIARIDSTKSTYHILLLGCSRRLP